MRFGPKFPLIPTSLPSEIYETTIKKQKQQLPEVQDERCKATELRLVKHIMQQIDPRIWTDPHIFPVNGDILLALSQLTEAGGSILIPKISQYLCTYNVKHKMYELHSTGGHLLARGDPGQLLSYAVKYARSTVDSIVSAMRLGLVPKIHEHLPLELLLKNYRRERAFCASLDRTSKNDELHAIDQAHVVNKFTLDLSERTTPECLHIGAGNSVCGSILSLLKTYDRVVAVDPRLCRSLDDIPTVFSTQHLKEKRDIVSDVAFGDEFGMTLRGQKQLIEQLYDYSTDRLVIVKCGLQKGIHARGVVRCKPRPHNLEVIVTLTPDGNTFDEIYEEWLPLVKEANEERNARVFKHEFELSYKPLANAEYEYRDLLLLDRKLPPVKPRYRKPINRNGVFFSMCGGKKSSTRLVSYVDAIKEYLKKPPNFYSILPSTFELSGNIYDKDPGFPDPDFSAASVIQTCISRGMRFENRGNMIVAC